jgi:hypothetical protein
MDSVSTNPAIKKYIVLRLLDLTLYRKGISSTSELRLKVKLQGLSTALKEKAFVWEVNRGSESNSTGNKHRQISSTDMRLKQITFKFILKLWEMKSRIFLKATYGSVCCTKTSVQLLEDFNAKMQS